MHTKPSDFQQIKQHNLRVLRAQHSTALDSTLKKSAFVLWNLLIFNYL